MELSEKQKELLQNFANLISYGHSYLSRVGLKRKKTSIRKKLFFYMFGATQSYAESILKIMAPTKSHTSIYAHSGLIIFRSIFENLINISWIYACDSQKNAAIFHIDFLQSTLKYSNRYRNLMTKYKNNKYSNWDLTFGNKKKPEDWNDFIEELEKAIKKEQRKYCLDVNSKLPPIEQRCMQHDVYWETKNKLKQDNCLEKLYVTYYPYFSGVVHLTAQGLDTFRDRFSDNMSIDSHPNDIEALIPITYTTYFSLLELFLKQFGVYDKNAMRGYRLISKSLLHQT